MSAAADPNGSSYEAIYERFDSPLMRRLRLEAYGEDVGQHSWVTGEELREDLSRLGLTRASRLLDLGCGPCGPLTFILSSVGCHGVGIERSAAALVSGRSRAAALGVDGSITLLEADLEQPLDLPSGAFDAAMALDVVLHLRDRTSLLKEAARTLVPGGRLLVTDAGVVTGALSNEEVSRRSIHGLTLFAAPGFNERAVEGAGLRLLETQDRTSGMLECARGRLAARLAHRDELEPLEGAAGFEQQRLYLDTVVALCERGALSRTMYLAESR
jgi:SAM-dependent methyltransferase